MMKCKTRRALAAALVAELVEKETRLRSNVRGQGKDPLDPKIMEFVQQQCFELFPSTGDSEEEWNRCIITIDEKARGLKRQLKKKQKEQQ